MEAQSVEMEAVEIKTEPLDDNDFNQIVREEVIIKSENEMDYFPSSLDIREPEVQISEDWLVPKEEPSTKDSVALEEPHESLTPLTNLSQNEDSLRSEESNIELNSNQCKFCDMFLKSRTALKLHERNCQYKNDCRLCGQKFVTSYALSTHLQKIHNRRMENASPQKEATRTTIGRPPHIFYGPSGSQCDICNLKFANSRDLNNHKKKHNTCQQCGEICKTYEDLKKHTCDNVVVKEEEDQSETETPTKKIFRATNSMVVIPDKQVHTPSRRSKTKVKTAKPKKKKSRALFQEHSNESSSENEHKKLPVDNNNLEHLSSPKSGFSVVTRDTDFEAFAQQMMKGFADISEPLENLPETESISDQILRKLLISAKEGERKQQGYLNKKNESDAEADAPQSENESVNSEGNVYKLLQTNFIKEEPLDDDDDYEANEPPKLKMPIPLPYIKDEPESPEPEQPDSATDNTDLLLEELFDRKAKKVRQTKFPFNPSFEPNGLGFKVKKEIKEQKSLDCDSSKSSSSTTKTKTTTITSSSPKKKKRKYALKNRGSIGSVQNVVVKEKPIALELGHVSRRKALPHKIKDDVLENTTNLSKKICLTFVPPKSTNSPNPMHFKAPNGKLPTLKNCGLDHFETISKQSQLLLDAWAKKKASAAAAAALAVAVDSAGDDTPYSSDYNCTSGDADQMQMDSENACSGGDDDEAALVVDETNCVSVKMEEDITCSSTSTLNGQGDISQQQFQIPSSGEFDFEDIIQSNRLPNFNNVNNVIKTLTEEYKKAEKVKLDDPPTFVEAKPVLPKAEVDEANKPASLFFPMLDDTQVYNMVANALNEKYRYVWICPACPRQYTQLRPFKKHLLTIHFQNDSELQGKAFELRPELVMDAGPNETFCHLCHVTLADNATLRKHQLEMHKEQDLTLRQKKKPLLHRCYICSKLCSSRTLLAEHMKSDCGKNPQYGCNVCDKKFHTKSTLNLHKTMHTGELPHSCSFCQKRFRTRGQLTVHTRTHTGEKPFPCKVCGQCFTHRETLIAHLSRHIDMKRYKCYGCEQFFSCISGLKTHRSVRPETCGRVELNARAVGPRVRVIKGNVIFEPQPIYNARLAKAEKPPLDSYILDHNYFRKDQTIQTNKKVSKQQSATIKSENITIFPQT
ncbi:uncharacterized protein LOC129943428 [Eupeodes corollae]|uniref:uncharacterized protein LOC129943428 n=1 Tax=Eupeodes corollae TaxID=290404 RepID=UPI0024938906|nr:uncharacterized protein LOC129943428 [Eupeodes corollae]